MATKKITPAQAAQADQIIADANKPVPAPAKDKEFSVTKVFILKVNEAASAVLKHQDTAVQFFNMAKEAKSKYNLSLQAFFHYFDSSIPPRMDAKATPKIDQKYIDSHAGFQRLRNLYRIGSVGVKRTVTNEGRKDKYNAKCRAIADVLRESKMSKGLVKKLFAILDTSKNKTYTADVMGLIWPVTVAEVQESAAKSAKTA